MKHWVRERKQFFLFQLPLLRVSLMPRTKRVEGWLCIINWKVSLNLKTKKKIIPTARIPRISEFSTQPTQSELISHFCIQNILFSQTTRFSSRQSNRRSRRNRNAAFCFHEFFLLQSVMIAFIKMKKCKKKSHWVFVEDRESKNISSVAIVTKRRTGELAALDLCNTRRRM